MQQVRSIGNALKVRRRQIVIGGSSVCIFGYVLSKYQSNKQKTHLPLKTSVNSAAEIGFKKYEFLSWPTEEVAKELDQRKLSEAAEMFKNKDRISEESLDVFTDKALQDLGLKKEEERREMLKLIRGTSDCVPRKVFNDPVHGHLEIHPLCVKIIDTPQFQRLRYIKQLGGCYYVYPGAGHNRFEHSLGVCHLAGQLTRSLKKRQPELNITNKDILCVEIAGLCHDLGHGPFSHLFDLRFIPAAKVLDDAYDSDDPRWKHETASVRMFQYMLESENLEEEFIKYGLTEQDITFIKEQIQGPMKKRNNHKFTYTGRDRKKCFLYDIVGNKKNGIDVDKWDYFARDCHGLGIKNNFEHIRFIGFARVVKANNELEICTRDKEAETVYGMFQTRATLHKRALQHRVCNAIEIMITEALLVANEVPLVPRKDGELLTLIDSYEYPDAYLNLNDSIFHTILTSRDEKLEKARQILEKVQRRQLYRCAGQTTPTVDLYTTRDFGNLSKIKQAQALRAEMMKEINMEDRNILTEDDLVVDIVSFHFGMDRKNPMENVHFYRKNDINTGVYLSKEQISLMLPGVCAEEMIRLYCKKEDEESLQLAKKMFSKWCKRVGVTQRDL